MKKLLTYVIVVFFVLSGSSFAFKAGKGELKLSYSTVTSFIEYIKMKGSKPYIFVVDTTGRYSIYYFCASGGSCQGGEEEAINQCERSSTEILECHLFAQHRTVRWKNGINPGGKKSE